MKALLIEADPTHLPDLRSALHVVYPAAVLVWVNSAQAARGVLASEPGVDLLVVDLDLRDYSAFHLLDEFQACYPSIKILTLATPDTDGNVMTAVSCGAMCNVSKRASGGLLVAALRQVLSGKVFAPPLDLQWQARAFAPDPLAEWRAERFRRARLVTREHAVARGMTARQTDVLQLLMQGDSNKQIARTLGVSVETVKDHVSAVLRVLNVSSRKEAVLAMNGTDVRETSQTST